MDMGADRSLDHPPGGTRSGRPSGHSHHRRGRGRSARGRRAVLPPAPLPRGCGVLALLMGLPTISPGDLARRMRSEPVTVIDVNARPSWERARVPGALHLNATAYTEN